MSVCGWILLVLAVAVAAFLIGVWAALCFKLAAFTTLFRLDRGFDQLYRDITCLAYRRKRQERFAAKHHELSESTKEERNYED